MGGSVAYLHLHVRSSDIPGVTVPLETVIYNSHQQTAIEQVKYTTVAVTENKLSLLASVLHARDTMKTRCAVAIFLLAAIMAVSCSPRKEVKHVDEDTLRPIFGKMPIVDSVRELQAQLSLVQDYVMAKIDPERGAIVEGERERIKFKKE